MVVRLLNLESKTASEDFIFFIVGIACQRLRVLELWNIIKSLVDSFGKRCVLVCSRVLLIFLSIFGLIKGFYDSITKTQMVTALVIFNAPVLCNYLVEVFFISNR